MPGPVDSQVPSEPADPDRPDGQARSGRDGRTQADLQPLALKTDHFEGPLDLLMHLVERNRLDIYNIPIETLTDQYLAWIVRWPGPDLETASEFLLMAATLLQIKSRLLLPQRSADVQADSADPRDELVMRLLAYRRCKILAGQLQMQYTEYAACQYKSPATAEALGLGSPKVSGGIDRDSFWLACRRLTVQNKSRFNDLSGKVSLLLKREKVSLQAKMSQIWYAVRRSGHVFFNELFPADRSSRAERVTGFLALLELLRLGQIRVRQDYPFDVMLIESGDRLDGPPAGGSTRPPADPLADLADDPAAVPWLAQSANPVSEPAAAAAQATAATWFTEIEEKDYD